MKNIRVLALVLLAVTATAVGVGAQAAPSDPTGLQASRQELVELLAYYEQAASSDAYSSALRAKARTEIELIRRRLNEGDLSVGDRVTLTVEGHPTLSDTFHVVAGRQLVLPDVGTVQLGGVLRSELGDHLTEHIGRFIRDPVVRAQSLIRMEIMGAVGVPGYYTIPSDILIGDALMLAGGPAAGAARDRIRIERGGDVVWSGELLQEAILEGRTLDQLSVRAGDAIVVPTQTDRRNLLQLGLTALTGLTSILLIAERLGAF